MWGTTNFNYKLKNNQAIYIYEKKELAEHPMFQQAVMLSEMTAKCKWMSLYMDPHGELAVSFEGRLSEEQVKTILMHFKDLIDGDTNVDKISCEYNVDYAYCNAHNADYRGPFTQVFTPDTYDYSAL